MNTNRSEQYFSEAQHILVGGVNSPVRSFKSVGGKPLVIKKGLKNKIYDADKNAYTDYCLSWGALILGHAHHSIIEAAKNAISSGTSFGTTTTAEIDLAKHITDCIPSIEKIRFVNSGTEATMSAIRLARGYTNREIIIKFDGCYHGHSDDLLTSAGSGVAELKESSSQGVPASHVENTLSLPYNDTEIVKKAITKYKNNIACVILEPVAGNMGVIPAEAGFLKALRDLTKKHNIVLIFDEVMTGFRTSAGGVQSEVKIRPDLTCLGKIIGGGFPVGAYGGKKEIMNCLAPLGGVYQAGTFSGNPVIMRTGLATLKMLNKDFYMELNEKCGIFASTLNKFFDKNDINAHMSNYRSMMSIRFRKEPVNNYTDAQAACGGELYEQLFKHLLNTGIYWPPAELETFFISGVHSEQDLNYLSQKIQSFWDK
jgi:glutamate-1-semialdehyde 2,1-aminomutase